MTKFTDLHIDVITSLTDGWDLIPRRHGDTKKQRICGYIKVSCGCDTRVEDLLRFILFLLTRQYKVRWINQKIKWILKWNMNTGVFLSSINSALQWCLRNRMNIQKCIMPIAKSLVFECVALNFKNYTEYMNLLFFFFFFIWE